MVLLNNHKIPNKPQSWKKTTTKTCYILSAFVKCRVKSLMSSLDDNRSCFKCCPLSTLCPPLPARWCCTRHIVQLKAPKFYPRDGFVRASSLQRSPFYLQYPPHHVQTAWQGGGGGDANTPCFIILWYSLSSVNPYLDQRNPHNMPIVLIKGLIWWEKRFA